MNTFSNRLTQVVARDVWFDEDKMKVFLNDGREISIPLEWFPRLRKANDKERSNWRLIGGGIGMHWEKLDEDISLEGLIQASIYPLQPERRVPK